MQPPEIKQEFLYKVEVPLESKPDETSNTARFNLQNQLKMERLTPQKRISFSNLRYNNINESRTTRFEVIEEGIDWGDACAYNAAVKVPKKKMLVQPFSTMIPKKVALVHELTIPAEVANDDMLNFFEYLMSCNDRGVYEKFSREVQFDSSFKKTEFGKQYPVGCWRLQCYMFNVRLRFKGYPGDRRKHAVRC